MLQEWLIWSEVIQAVFPPPTPNEVAEKLAYIPVTLKVPIETPKTNSGHVASSRIHVNRVVMIAPYYEEAVLGRRVKIPLKPFKERKITISTEGKEVATITGNCSGNTTLDFAKNHTKNPETLRTIFVAKTPSPVKEANMSAMSNTWSVRTKSLHDKTQGRMTKSLRKRRTETPRNKLMRKYLGPSRRNSVISRNHPYCHEKFCQTRGNKGTRH